MEKAAGWFDHQYHCDNQEKGLWDNQKGEILILRRAVSSLSCNGGKKAGQ